MFRWVCHGGLFAVEENVFVGEVMRAVGRGLLSSEIGSWVELIASVVAQEHGFDASNQFISSSMGTMTAFNNLYLSA